MTYNVFGGTLSLTQSINHVVECDVIFSWRNVQAVTEKPGNV